MLCLYFDILYDMRFTKNNLLRLNVVLVTFLICSVLYYVFLAFYYNGTSSTTSVSKKRVPNEVYIGESNGFMFEYGRKTLIVEWPDLKNLKQNGIPLIKASERIYYYIAKLPKCTPEDVYPCIAPNWNSEEYIQTTKLDGNSAISFFIHDETLEGLKVFHVVQTNDPSFEIFSDVDGLGGEEGFQHLLSKFKFID